MIKGHTRGTDGNCLSGSKERSLGTERCEAAGRLRAGDWGLRPSSVLMWVTLAQGLCRSGPLFPHL